MDRSPGWCWRSLWAQFKVLESLHMDFKGKKVLNVGTGRGMFSIWFAAKGAAVDAVDLNSEMLEIARRNASEAGHAGHIQFIQDNAETLEHVADGTCDVVSCMQTFDHIPRLDRAIAALVSKLKPGGILLYTFCTPQSIYGWAYAFYRKVVSRFYRLNDETGLVARMYDSRSIRELMRVNGIEIDREYGVGLLCLPLRPEFERGLVTAIPRRVNRVEERMFPYYRSAWLARRCTHVIGVGRARCA